MFWVLFCFLRKGLIVAQAGPDLTMQTGLAPNSQTYSCLCLLSARIKAGKPIFFILTRLLSFHVFGVCPRTAASHAGAVPTEAARGYLMSGAGHTGA